jgi:predicted transcriptional regulator of viral defense system
LREERAAAFYVFPISRQDKKSCHKIRFAKNHKICLNLKTTAMKEKEKRRGNIREWVENLPSQGRYCFTRSEVVDLLRVNPLTFNRMMLRMAKRNEVERIRGGFYVVVPLEYRKVGIIPPEWFIVELMRYLKQPFYIGLLSASAYHGASHQASQSFHVVTSKATRECACKGMRVRFFKKQSVAKTKIEQRKGVTGFLPVSTPEETAFDLLRFHRQIGGLDHVLTLLQELGEQLSPARLIETAKKERVRAFAQRLGWLLEQAGFKGKAAPLLKWIRQANPVVTMLEPARPQKGSLFDARWNLWINTTLEGDRI